MKENKDDSIYAAVYAALVALTLLTVASCWLGFAPILGVTFAIAVAAMKACLIGYYFMHLKDDPAIVFGIVVIGAAAVLILAVGILPDIALKLS